MPPHEGTPCSCSIFDVSNRRICAWAFFLAAKLYSQRNEFGRSLKPCEQPAYALSNISKLRWALG